MGAVRNHDMTVYLTTLVLYERNTWAAIANKMTNSVITIKIVRFHAVMAPSAVCEIEKNSTHTCIT